MKYTYIFEGTVTVTADSEEKAYELADSIVAPSMWAHDNCDEISVYNIELNDTEESEE